MTIKILLTAAAATALMAGAAHAQLGTAAPGANQADTTNQSSPADPKTSQTGLPSVDMTRPTGADAGKTNMQNGTVDGQATSAATTGADTSATGSTSGATTGSATGSATGAMTDTAAGSTGAGATASTGMATNTSAATSTTNVSNGPVADTPENRAKYRPLSRAGRATSAKGN